MFGRGEYPPFGRMGTHSLKERCNFAVKVALFHMGPKKDVFWIIDYTGLAWTRTGARLYFRQRSRRVLSRYVQRWCKYLF